MLHSTFIQGLTRLLVLITALMSCSSIGFAAVDFEDPTVDSSIIESPELSLPQVEPNPLSSEDVVSDDSSTTLSTEEPSSTPASTDVQSQMESTEVVSPSPEPVAETTSEFIAESAPFSLDEANVPLSNVEPTYSVVVMQIEKVVSDTVEWVENLFTSSEAATIDSGVEIPPASIPSAILSNDPNVSCTSSSCACTVTGYDSVLYLAEDADWLPYGMNIDVSDTEEVEDTLEWTVAALTSNELPEKVVTGEPVTEPGRCYFPDGTYFLSQRCDIWEVESEPIVASPSPSPSPIAMPDPSLSDSSWTETAMELISEIIQVVVDSLYQTVEMAETLFTSEISSQNLEAENPFPVSSEENLLGTVLPESSVLQEPSENESPSPESTVSEASANYSLPIGVSN